MVTESKLRISPDTAAAEPDYAGMWSSSRSVRADKLEWLLPGFISANSLTVLEGDPGTGKSTLLAALVASVTTGKSWLGRKKTEPRNVLWLSKDESYSALLRPRLLAAGVDIDRVHHVEEGVNGAPKRITIDGSMGFIAGSVAAFDAALLIIEPLLSFVSSTLSPNSPTDMRLVLDPLQQVMMDRKCTAIVTRILRKNRQGDPLNHGQGTSEIAAIARSVVLLQWPDRDCPRRIMRRLKSYAPSSTPPIGYEVVTSAGTSVLQGAHPLSRVEDEQSEEITDKGERGAREDAKALLRKLLATEWVRTSVLRAAADDAMITPATLRRAREDLKVQTRQTADAAGSFHEWGPPETGWQVGGGVAQSGEHVGGATKKTRKKAGKKA